MEIEVKKSSTIFAKWNDLNSSLNFTRPQSPKLNKTWVEAESLLRLACNFECCPYCGSEDIGGHFCNDCKERYTEPEDAYWFFKKLEKLIKGGK